jgi:hypothetical protein
VRYKGFCHSISALGSRGNVFHGSAAAIVSCFQPPSQAALVTDTAYPCTHTPMASSTTDTPDVHDSDPASESDIQLSENHSQSDLPEITSKVLTMSFPSV